MTYAAGPEPPIGTPTPEPDGAAAWVAEPTAALSVAEEIGRLLPDTAGQLGEVAKCLADGITDRKAIVEAGAAANTGAVANILSNIRAIQDGEVPAAPSLARLSRSSASSFLKQHRTVLSQEAVDQLESVIVASEAVATDRGAQDREEEVLQRKGTELEDTLAVQGGVYVFTYPHYWRHPTVEGTKRTLLKIGMTTKDAGERVKVQARQAGLPEDPLLLRVYQSQTLEPAAAEKRFHRLLRAADHSREDANAGGKEWFETSIEFLDTIADTLDMEILEANDE